MKKHLYLSLIATLVLSACGGGGSGDNGGSANSGDNGDKSEIPTPTPTPTPDPTPTPTPDPTPTPPKTVTIAGRAIADTPLAGQVVCLDLNANQQCDTGETQATTDSDGSFTFIVPESQNTDAEQALAILAAPAAKPQARVMSNAITTSVAMTGYFDGSSFTISPFTHQLVNSTSPDQRKTHYESSIATKAKLEIATNLNMTQKEANEQHLFGDYLAAGDENSLVLAKEAAIKSQQMAEAAQQQAQLANLLATSNPDGWTSVTVLIQNQWDQNFQLQTLQHLRTQTVTYSKRVGDIETIRTEGTKWLLDDQGNYNVQLPFEGYTSEINKDWAQKQQREFATWAYDMNQDGDATFKGEKATQGTFSQDENGLYSSDAIEFYNEGDPATEGAESRPGRVYCEGFDIQGTLAMWLSDNSLPVNKCVNFVENRSQKESWNTNNGDLSSLDTMTEWQSPNIKGQGNGDETWLIVKNSPDYYEPRSQIITALGDVKRLTQHDWHALTLNAPNLGQSPFNVSRDEQRLHNGDETIKQSQPFWRYSNKLGNSINGFERIELQNYNPTRWGHYKDAYIEQDYQQLAGGFTLQSRFFQQDERQLDGFAYPLNLKYAGNVTPFTTQDWQFDDVSQTLKVKHHYQSVTDEIVWVLPWPYDLIQGQPMDLEASIQLQQSNGLPSATQVTSVDGGNAISTPTFAQEIFNPQLNWAIDNPSTDPEVKALVELLFGQTPLAFTANRDTSTQRQCELGQSGTSVQQNLLFAPIGGDMVLNLTCHESNGNWVMEQYLLRITNPYNGTAFQAELLDFAEGANIYRDEPRQRYPLSFIKQ